MNAEVQQLEDAEAVAAVERAMEMIDQAADSEEAAYAVSLARHMLLIAKTVDLATRGAAGDLVEHIRTRGRVPVLGVDERAPWTYQGWMLPYIMDIYPGQVCGAKNGGHQGGR